MSDRVKSDVFSKQIDCITSSGTFELALRGHHEQDNLLNPDVIWVIFWQSYTLHQRSMSIIVEQYFKTHPKVFKTSCLIVCLKSDNFLWPVDRFWQFVESPGHDSGPIV